MINLYCNGIRYWLKELKKSLIFEMFRSISSLSIPKTMISQLRDNGFIFVEDTYDESVSELPSACRTAIKIIHELCKVPTTVSALDIWQEELQEYKVPTFSLQLDNILGGGFQCKTITELCGAPGSGKTQIWDTTICCTVDKYGNEIFTEIAMSQRQGYTHNQFFNMDSVVVSCPKTLHELLANLRQLTQLQKIRLIILDSISFLGYSIENIRERTQIYFRILDKLQEISVNLNLPVVVTSELSTGVTSTGDVDLVGAGGTLLAHRIHKRFMLTRLNATQFAAHALKSPNIPKVAVKFQVDADGIKDVISSTRLVT